MNELNEARALMTQSIEILEAAPHNGAVALKFARSALRYLDVIENKLAEGSSLLRSIYEEIDE